VKGNKTVLWWENTKRSRRQDFIRKNVAKIGAKDVDWNILAQNTERSAPVKTISNPQYLIP
jgi:hypothetical protein